MQIACTLASRGRPAGYCWEVRSRLPGATAAAQVLTGRVNKRHSGSWRTNVGFATVAESPGLQDRQAATAITVWCATSVIPPLALGRQSI